MSITNEQVHAALRKLGPSSPAAIAGHLNADTHATGARLRAMLEEKLVKAAGVRRGRKYALPDQEFGGNAPTPTPSQQRRQHKPRKHAKRGAQKRRQQKAPPARTAERFIPTVDADLRLHIINGGAPLCFDAPQTEAIATLLFQHYKA